MSTIIGNSEGYHLEITRAETERWAAAPGALWSWSRLAGQHVEVDVDYIGLVNVRVNCQPGCQWLCQHLHLLNGVEMGELQSLISAHLPQGFRHLWPCREQQLPEEVVDTVVDGLMKDAQP